MCLIFFSFFSSESLLGWPWSYTCCFVIESSNQHKPLLNCPFRPLAGPLGFVPFVCISLTGSVSFGIVVVVMWIIYTLIAKQWQNEANVGSLSLSLYSSSDHLATLWPPCSWLDRRVLLCEMPPADSVQEFNDSWNRSEEKEEEYTKLSYKIGGDWPPRGQRGQSWVTPLFLFRLLTRSRHCACLTKRILLINMSGSLIIKYELFAVV